MYIYLFYGYYENSLLLETSFQNENFYESYSFVGPASPLMTIVPCVLLKVFLSLSLFF